MAGEHPIQGLMKTTMESIREMVDVNTIVGEPVETVDGSVIVPVSRVSFGFAAGGGEYGAGIGGGNRRQEREGGGGESGLAFGGGSGAGVTIQPVGFLVVGRDSVRMLPVDGRAVVDRLIDAVPGALNELRNLFTGGIGEALGGLGGHGGHGHGRGHGGHGCGAGGQRGEERNEGEGREEGHSHRMWRGHRHGEHEGGEKCDCGQEHASDQQGALTSRQEQPEDR